MGKIGEIGVVVEEKLYGAGLSSREAKFVAYAVGRQEKTVKVCSDGIVFYLIPVVIFSGLLEALNQLGLKKEAGMLKRFARLRKTQVEVDKKLYEGMLYAVNRKEVK